MSLAINMTSSYDPSTSTSSAKKWQCDSNASDAESELDLFPPRGKRLAPVGANADDDDDSSCRKAEVLRTLMCEAEQQQLMQQQGGGSAGEAEELRKKRKFQIGRPAAMNRVEIYDQHGVRRECVETFWDRFEEAFLLMAQDFVDCIIEGCQPELTLADARQATKAAVAFTESFKQGRLVKL